MDKKKIAFKVLIFLLAIVAVERFCYMQTGGFKIGKVYADVLYVPKEASLKFPSREEEHAILPMLDQPFHYYGKGVQSYVFLGEDGTTILKLFKHHHSWPSTSLLRTIPFPPFLMSWKNALLKEREKRMFSILRSCHIAFSSYKEETGVLYVHLQPSQHLGKQLALVDKLGIRHSLDADRVEFVLQRKAELVFEHFDALLKKNDLAMVEKSIDSLIDLIIHRSALGIANQDAIIYRNFGFIDNKAVEIDIGSFGLNSFLKKNYQMRQELFYETLQLKEWFQKNHPELVEYLDKKIASVL